MANFIDRITSANFLPSMGNGRFYVFGKQFNDLVDKVNSLYKTSSTPFIQTGSKTTTVATTGTNFVLMTVALTDASGSASFDFTITNPGFKAMQHVPVIKHAIVTGNGAANVNIVGGTVADGTFNVRITNVSNAAFNNVLMISLGYEPMDFS